MVRGGGLWGNMVDQCDVMQLTTQRHEQILQHIATDCHSIIVSEVLGGGGDCYRLSFNYRK